MMNLRQRKALGLGLLAALIVPFLPQIWKSGSHAVPIMKPAPTETSDGGIVYGTPSVDLQIETEPLGKVLIVGMIVAVTGAIVYLRRTPAV